MSKLIKTRQAPYESATNYNVDTKKIGIDGNMWIITLTKNGTHRWSKLNNTKILSKPKKIKKYYTHNNGSRPYMVTIEDKTVSIYKLSNTSKNTDYTHLVKTYNNVKEIFIGNSIKGDDALGNKKFGLGNSILIEININKYVFIGEYVYEFSTTSKIEEFFSMIGNNDVPYPVAIDKNNVYFLINMGIYGFLSRKYFIDFPNKYSWGLHSYSKLWMHTPFIYEYIDETKYKNMKYIDQEKLRKKISLENKTHKIKNIKMIN